MKGFAVLGTITMLAVAPVFAQTPAAPAGAKPAPQAPPPAAPATQPAPAPAPAPAPPRPFPEGAKMAFVVLQRIANESLAEWAGGFDCTPPIAPRRLHVRVDSARAMATMEL